MPMRASGLRVPRGHRAVYLGPLRDAARRSGGQEQPVEAQAGRACPGAGVAALVLLPECDRQRLLARTGGPARLDPGGTEVHHPDLLPAPHVIALLDDWLHVLGDEIREARVRAAVER